MKFGVVVFPGSNCDRDMMYALEHNLDREVKALWHKDSDLSHFNTEDCIVLPGGFSYGDYLRCGAIARFSPMMKSVIEFANAGGKVFGVCNGFQILCESGLLPGVLLRNAAMKFVCKNVFIKKPGQSSATVYKIPVAHGEGKYYASNDVIKQLENNSQILYQYCNEAGVIEPACSPNGSLQNIAGICNERKNVIGMMPHPERACSSDLGNVDGTKIFAELFSIN